MNPLYFLALAIGGFLLVVGTVLLVARTLVYRHADAYAAAVRAGRVQLVDEHPASVERVKVVAR